MEKKPKKRWRSSKIPPGVAAQNKVATLVVVDKYNFGRPTTYDPSYCNAVIDWFSGTRVERILKRKVVTPNGDGTESVAEEYVERPGRFPTFEGFAHFVCNTGVTTLKSWRDQHPDFSTACTRARQLQKDWLCEVMGKGLGNAAWTMFLARNLTDLRDDPPVSPTAERRPFRIMPFGDRNLKRVEPATDGQSHSNGNGSNGHNGNGHADPVPAQ